MPNIQLKQEDKMVVKINHQMEMHTHRRVDVYLSLPKEMGISAKTLKESNYFTSNVISKHSYYSPGLHLPLLQSRFASMNNLAIEEYRVNLNLFAYQYAIALDVDLKLLLKEQDIENFYNLANSLMEQSSSLLKKFRRSTPTGAAQLAHFENADNYLSWHTEQVFMKLIATRPRNGEFSEQLKLILDYTRSEKNYRTERAYNSTATIKDPNRIANKMRLIRRLIEYGVVFKEKTYALGNTSRKFVTGLATALIMVVVLSLIIKTQGALSGLTALMVVVLATIYGVREVFKEDLKNALWRWISKGRAKWSRELHDSANNTLIAKQKIWLDYIRTKHLPVPVADILAHRHRRNRQAEELLHYRIESRVFGRNFRAGYSAINESLYFNLRPFARYLEGGRGVVYQEDKGKISKESIERRYQINLILAIADGDQEPIYQRYKITLNRSKIADIEAA
ncbi:hypothetical protein ACRRS0_13110 [Agarivorans sp. QJM3NY_29]|uniref:hypothetical protein n=1 Tax=unclassified Agarivorans TaxID=2636026 RepID=UPI003D7C48DA